MECWVSGWTAPKQEVTEAVREDWMWELGKDECVHTDAGPETSYWRGTEFGRMGGYDFPGQIAGTDGSEGNGVMGTGFIVLGGSLWRQDPSEWIEQKRARTRRGRK